MNGYQLPRGVVSALINADGDTARHRLAAHVRDLRRSGARELARPALDAAAWIGWPGKGAPEAPRGCSPTCGACRG